MTAAEIQARTLLDYAIDGDAARLRAHARHLRETYWRTNIRRDGVEVVVQVKRSALPPGIVRWHDPSGQMYAMLRRAVHGQRKLRAVK